MRPPASRPVWPQGDKKKKEEPKNSLELVDQKIAGSGEKRPLMAGDEEDDDAFATTQENVKPALVV